MTIERSDLDLEAIKERVFLWPAPTEARSLIFALVEEVERLTTAIEDYLLWRPGEKGHAEAHGKLAKAVRGYYGTPNGLSPQPEGAQHGS